MKPLGRRTFLSYAVGLLGLTPALAQQAITEKGKAVVCSDNPIECPNHHKTCKSINAPLAIGGGTYQNPEVACLRDYTLMRCEICHVLFTLE